MLTDDSSGNEGGLEFSAGASYRVSPRFGAFAGFRANKPESDDGNEKTIDDFRIGVGVNL